MVDDLYDNENDAHVHRYYSIDDYSAILSRSDLNFHILNLNIRSYNKNSDELQVLLEHLVVKPDVIILTETWFSNDYDENLNGYNAFHSFREERRGGGVTVYVKSKYSSSCVSRWSYVGPNMEICSVAFLKEKTRFVIHGIYRPPDRNVVMFNDEISALFDDVNRSDNVFFAGDLNIDIANPNGAAVDFIALCHSYSFVPLIMSPTHSAGSCIDHIWYNQLIGVESGVLELDITDHYPVFASACVGPDCGVDSFFVKKFRDHSSTSLKTLQEEMAVVSPLYVRRIAEEDSDIDVLTESFLNDVFAVYDRCCPLRSKRVSYNRHMKPWITGELIACIRRKHALFREYKRRLVSFEYYNYFKNHVTNLIRQAKRRYFTTKFKSQLGNAAGTWKYINSFLRRKTKKSVPAELISDGVLVSDPAVIANEFSEYFSNIAQNLDDRIPRTDVSAMTYMSDIMNSSFFVTPVTEFDVASVISKLKNKFFGFNSLPTIIYKYCSTVLSPVIADLFNASVQHGKFPSPLKLARVTPIFKSGDATVPSNYRPISILTDLSKVFEKLMYKQLSGFLKSFDVLTACQFGFQQNSSTSDALLEYLDHVYMNLNVKRSVVSVLLDFSKAFDTVRHDILVDKLYHVGIRGGVLNWFNSYLSDRRQYVSINNCNSSHSIVNSGVPQGSVLGPILFLIYINDMSNCSRELNFVHFADDTTVFFSGDVVDDAVAVVNVELLKVQNWLYANRLSLNTNKTSAMIMSNTRTQNFPPVRISGADIEYVSQANFLGVTIDRQLNFKCHVERCVRAVSKAIGMIRRVSDIVPSHARRLMYYSLVYSRISYGIVAWGGSGVGNVTRMERLLRRARNAVVHPGGPDLIRSFLSFDSVFKYFSAVKLYKVINQNQHPYFCRIFVELKPNHAHNTRFSSSSSFNNPRFAKAKCQNSFVYRAVHVWNDIPESIRCSAFPVFKRLLRRELLLNQRIIV